MYQGHAGKLILYNKDREVITVGTKINQNLYKFSFESTMKDNSSESIYAMTNQSLQSWEIWHRCFGHVGYTGLKVLYDRNLVEGFDVDTLSKINDCTTCIQAKSSVQPFKGHHIPCAEKGEITHIDLWGKYDVTSIKGNQYYLLLIDDATRYVTLKFLKAKSDAAHEIQAYMSHLQIRGHVTYAIKIDRGTEFLNQPMKTWCDERGIQLHLIAERMNHTLVELACAMLTVSHLPEFLWEPVVNHAAYVQNRSYIKAIQNKTPYKGWHNIEPNVSYLREFGSLVGILLQGQHMQRKMLPKSTQYYYVGNEDNSQSIIYYNKETRKLNILRNFYFLKDPLENVLNNHACEGEWPGHIPVDTRKINSMDNKQLEAGPDTYKKEERDT